MREHETGLTRRDVLAAGTAGALSLALGRLAPAAELFHAEKPEITVVLVRRKGAGDRVVFAAAADVATQRAWLARASALAAPSLHFRPPVSIMQAVATGVPVIASDRAAPDGLDAVSRMGPPSREALREILRAVLGITDDQRATLAREAREVGCSLFDWSVRVETFVRLYQSVA